MRLLRFSLLFALLATAVGACVQVGVYWTVESAVKRDAVEKAERWGEFIRGRLPRIEALVSTGRPDPEQMQSIRDVRTLGDVFRFKLFDGQGRLTLVSDDSNLSGPAGVADTSDPEPLMVLATGRPVVEFKDGRAKPNRPDYYAEAYVPIFDARGATSGVAEVYVDQTATHQYFVSSFRTFGGLLALACIVLVATPSAAYFFQRRAAERAKGDAEYLARYDALTGVMNRREFVSSLQADDARPLSAIAFLDLDRFKQINDTHGHAGGDALLIHVAEVLKRCAGPDDLVARFGGDEFVIAMRDLPADTIDQRMTSILRQCEKSVRCGNASLSGAVSIGVSLCDGDVDLDTALSQADAALYSAKESGRNQYAIYGVEMGERLRQRRRMEKRLRDALQNEEFALHYHALIDTSNNQITGFEALLRLDDEDGSPIPPSDFIPIAEELGIISKIGRWVIETGVREAASWDSDQKISLNLSPLQFDTGDLPSIVVDALAASGLPPGRLELEITETVLLRNEREVQLQLDRLQELGVSIALDDFGTGFSSLGYLWKYGFDKLKIDRSFVSALDHSPERAAEIIETIILLGRRLGMKVTAEGIETDAQAQKLRDMGCDQLQGFLFGKPAPLHNANKDEKMLATG